MLSATLPSVDLSRYVGLPYKMRGRDFSGIDCLGLVQAFYRDELGVEIPNYLYCDTFDIDSCADAIKGGALDGNWRQTVEPTLYGLLVFKVLGHPTHVGLYLGGDDFLHAFQGRNSCIERLSDWSRRLAGCYQWR